MVVSWNLVIIVGLEIFATKLTFIRSDVSVLMSDYSYMWTETSCNHNHIGLPIIGIYINHTLLNIASKNSWAKFESSWVMGGKCCCLIGSSGFKQRYENICQTVSSYF